MPQTAKISKDDLEAYEKVFLMLDKDGTGGIEADELGAAMVSLGLNPSEAEVAEIIHEIDKNKDGKIDFNEFIELMTQVTKYEGDSKNDELLDAFKVFDKDGSGSISAAELHQVLAEQGERYTSEEIEEMIAHVDLDNNGLIDYQEFALLMGHK